MAVGTPCGSGAPLIWGETRVTATAGKSGQSLLIRAKGLRISPGPLLELLEQWLGSILILALYEDISFLQY